MTTTGPPIAPPLGSRDAAHRYIRRICFKTGPPDVVGAELEWLVADPAHPNDPVPLDRLQDAFRETATLPGGSTLTFEPGGQLELSSPPATGLASCRRTLDADLTHVDDALSRLGLTLLTTAIDPHRPPRRQLREPRYDAMEAYYDRRGTVGRTMMCSTAAVQVNLDAGVDAADVVRRWQALNTLGPVLVAAFANSPRHAGRLTGWKSSRQAVWLRLDPPRTSRPVPGVDPATGWADYALDAPVMLMRRDSGDWITDPGITFRQWLDAGSAAYRPPTEDDLAYHLTTLFPPVRPRAWFEVRYVDAQPRPWWPVPVALLVGLLADAATAERATAAALPVADAWETAARCALTDPALGLAARRCFTLGIESLRRVRAGPDLVALVEAYAERYVDRGRCPADDAIPTTRGESG
ncbi:MAG: ergothioneine biosynthesis glutamate--cysteine ligase EgtA [Streptosporangiales bacterium]|nr:ergothioneine biosynthesis glutamate--cysteine ligase EgtA [Streptosporangiales bacterium]MBO0890307.1 ergothioneine biosynthesis glutamate--cysteine ligase EgtA [Acidothermales bacterium]